MSTDDLTRRGYEGEVRRHRETLERALAEARWVLDSLDTQTRSGTVSSLTSETRRLLAAAGDAAQAAAALSAADQLSFTVDPDR